MRRWLTPTLHGKLLAAHLMVILVGVVTLFLAASAIAPGLFDRLMAEAMGPQMQAMGGAMPGEMGAAMSEITGRVFRQATIIALGVAATAAALTAVGVSLFVSERVAGPVRRMAGAAKRIAAGRYAERVPPGEPDELGQLAASFNEMAAALEDAERRRLQLIGDVAHELRTPIANLQGRLEGLLDRVVEPSDQTWAVLLGETDTLRRLAQDLQELSRAEARQVSLELQPIAPGRLVDLALVRLGPQFAEKGLTLDAVVAPGLPAVLADESRTVQVLTNLLHNALRYTPAGGRVAVQVERQGEGVVFRVRDSGIGVAPEHLPHLFERFYRAEESRSRGGGGSGIGLTIARALVEAMGGRIWGESPGPGRGATFSFVLPTAS